MKTVLPWLWLVPVPLVVLFDLGTGNGWWLVAASVMAAATAVPGLVLAQRRPGIRARALLVAGLGLLLALALSAASGLVSATTLWLSLVALAMLARWQSAKRIVWLLIAVGLGNVIVPALIPGDGLTFAFAVSTLVVVAIAFGLLMRMVDRSLLERHATAAEAERRRMATDLHDLVAHEITGIVVLSQAAARSDDPTLLKTTLGRIEESGSRALEEIRSLVANPTAPAVSSAPGSPRAAAEHRPAAEQDADEPGAEARAEPAVRTPTAAGPENLRQRLDDFGTSDHAETTSSLSLTAAVPTSLWPVLDRILIEALTNIRRHAGPGARVSMAISSDLTGVELTVENTMSTGGIGRGSGTGLQGLRTRVESLGGSLSAAPHNGDTWRLSARLPLGSAR